MFGDLDKYLAVFLTGLVASLTLTPLVRKLAWRFNVVDRPDERRPHKKPTARGGGLAVVIAVHLSCLFALVLPWPQVAGGLDLYWWKRFLLASLVLLVVGVIDDVRGLRPWYKLGGQALAAIQIWFAGARFGDFLGMQLPLPLDCFLVVFWLLAVINAFNLIDGLDGLASGLAIISATGLCGIFVFGHMPGNVMVLLGLIGACVGFLRYNFHPASVFLGDTGSMFLGFTLGVVSLQTSTKSTFLLSMTIPLLVLGVPIYDALLAIWRRSVRRWLTSQNPGSLNRRGIMQPDLEHLHHRLLKAGFSTRRVATVLCILNGALVVFGLMITVFHSHATGIFLLALLAGVYVLMRHLAVIELRDTGRAILSGLHRPTHATLKALFYPVWDMACMSLALALAMRMYEQPSVDFWHTWFLDLPVWVTPTFSLFAISRTYVTVWTRARLLDVLMIAFILVLGSLLSLAIALVIDPSESSRWFFRFVVISALSHPAIICVRIIYRSLEELVIYFRSKSETRTGLERVVLYGAGGRCQLFLKERSFNNSRSFDNREIVGLIDDEPALQAQWVHGYPVLGSLQNLPQLIAKYRIAGIIITAAISPESLAEAKALATQHGLHLSEWRFREENLVAASSPRQQVPVEPTPGTNPRPEPGL